jgi:hypothetical protein
VKQCFIEKRAQLSPGCVAALDALPAKRGKRTDGYAPKAR